MGDVYIMSGAQVILDGEYIFHGDVYVSGSGTRLDIEPGSVLLFANEKKLHVFDGGRFDVDGTSAEPVIFDLWADLSSTANPPFERNSNGMELS